MNLLSNLNDDQLALLGCVGALLASGSLMSLSYFFGRWRISVPATVKSRSAVGNRAAGRSAEANAKRRRHAA